MSLKLTTVLRFFIGAISLLLLYMLLSQEIPIHSLRGGSLGEVVRLHDEPVRFILIFLFLLLFDGYLIKQLRRQIRGE